jgi:dUTP pyrophosphatase
MAILSGGDIRALIQTQPPLVEGYLDLDQQVQANGFDLSLRDIGVMQTGGQVAADNAGRVIPEVCPLMFDALGFIDLPAGIYMVTYNEVVHLPKNIMALGRPRSSLLRCGVTVGTAVWDAGYEGRSQSLLVVYNTRGFRVQRNARITQLVFMELTGHSEGYHGFYQGENL